jgi:hypothetical protein
MVPVVIVVVMTIAGECEAGEEGGQDGAFHF